MISIRFFVFCVYKLGFNCGEAANFGTPQWLKVAKDAAVRRAAMNYLPMLSHQQLLYLLTMSFVSRLACYISLKYSIDPNGLSKTSVLNVMSVLLHTRPYEDLYEIILKSGTYHPVGGNPHGCLWIVVK